MLATETPTLSPRAWVLLPSGKRLDLLDPTPFDWDDQDLALGLARTYRWGGHSAWPLPLSVAQHSLAVLAICRHGRQRWTRGGNCGNCCTTPMKACWGSTRSRR